MLSLTVEPRLKSEKVRKENFLPGIVYGKDVGNMLIKLPYVDFEKIYKKAGESTVINLRCEIENGKIQEFPVLIREIQKDPLSDKFIHVDFYQLPMDEEVEVTIPLEFIGEAPAESQLGGVLIKNIHEVDIKALPKNLISSIKVDVSSLKTFEDAIKIKDLIVPAGVKILANPEEIVALIGKVEEEKIETVPTETEEKPEEPEVIKKEKKTEEEEE
ncbi:MAG TPA: 50S ribosomal protein L25 [Candidatus Pacearchaeota archaeon]|nr:50S ribosomal protein L25 [Candidatus Pacearchaeota archaeon]HOK94269.1 50S ribosomal protein L25 [Candidatus Pacearchaeota archaeon]HPO75383.1 50S ribosomal protein L25 [Candidatus Pacearchaeota archaeon]